MNTASEAPSFARLWSEALQRWPWLVVSMAAAALLTVALFRWRPWRVRAEVPLSVRIDLPRPGFVPPELLYIQAEHLQQRMTAPEVLEDVHAHLPPELKARLTPETLGRRVAVDWRLTQRWYLVAYGRTPQEARAIVQTWADRLETYWLPQWEEATREHLARREALWLAQQAWVKAQQHAAWARAARQRLPQWMETQRTLPPEAPLEPAAWQELMFWVAVAQYGPEAATLSPPPREAPRSQVLAWVQDVLMPRLAAVERAAQEAAQQAQATRQELENQPDPGERAWLSPWYPVAISREGEVVLSGRPTPAVAALFGTVLGLGLWVAGLFALVSLPRNRAASLAEARPS